MPGMARRWVSPPGLGCGGLGGTRLWQGIWGFLVSPSLELSGCLPSAWLSGCVGTAPVGAWHGAAALGPHWDGRIWEVPKMSAFPPRNGSARV